MRKRWFLSIILLISVFALAVPIDVQAKADDPGKGPPAIEVVVLVHYPKGHAPDKDTPEPAKPGAPKPGDEASYKTIGKWAMTRLAAVANLSSVSEADHTSFLGGLTDGFVAWDSASGLTVSLTQGTAVNSSYLTGTRDGVNVVSWQSLAAKYPNAIAVAWVWRYVNTKEIIEADIAMASEYPWFQNTVPGDPDLATGVGGYMDVQNIATHEFGHFVGLGDLRSAAEQTMYAYSNYTEVKKRSLEAGDIAGVQKLYGS